MPRKLSRAALEEELSRVRRAYDVHTIAMYEMANHPEPDASETIVPENYPHQHYELRLYGARRVDGGLVVTVYTCPGQPKHVDVDWLDDMAYPSLPDYLPFRSAVERFKIVRSFLIDRRDAA